MPYMDDIHGMHVEDVEVFLPKDSATLLCFFYLIPFRFDQPQFSTWVVISYFLIVTLAREPI